MINVYHPEMIQEYTLNMLKILKVLLASSLLTLVACTMSSGPSNTYRNEDYGFSFSPFDEWRGYEAKVETKPDEDIAAIVHIGFPTNNSAWDGFADVLYFVVYSPENWEKISKNEGPKPSYLSRNSKYVFSYAAPHDLPDEHQARIRQGHYAQGELASRFTVFEPK